MPSSHTAGAVAYATAASLQSPPLALVLLPAASAVSWSRTASGRHFPTDVVAGAALGLVAGAAVHRVLAPPARQPVTPTGAGADDKVDSETGA
jgi:undecaprenyl-diphosphatase